MAWIIYNGEGWFSKDINDPYLLVYKWLARVGETGKYDLEEHLLERWGVPCPEPGPDRMKRLFEALAPAIAKQANMFFKED
jgi:hypothetical protein